MWHAAPWIDQRIGAFQEDHYPLIDIYGVVITNERGKRMSYVGPVACDTKETAERLANYINAYTHKNTQWEPKSKYWSPWHPVYGSEEYQSSGEEQIWKAQERQMDLDGPDPRLPYVSR